MGPDLDLDRKHQTPTLSHHTPQFSLKIKGLTFLTLAQKSLKYSLLSNIIITFYQDHRLVFLTLQNPHTPSLKPPPKSPNLVIEVAHPSISEIFTFLLDLIKPQLLHTYHRNRTRESPFYYAQDQALPPTFFDYTSSPLLV